MYYSPFFSYTANFEFEPEAERKVTYSLDIKIIDDDEVSTSSFASGEFTPNGTLFFFFFFLGPPLLSIAASLFRSQAASAFLAIRRISNTRRVLLKATSYTASAERRRLVGCPFAAFPSLSFKRSIAIYMPELSRSAGHRPRRRRTGETVRVRVREANCFFYTRSTAPLFTPARQFDLKSVFSQIIYARVAFVYLSVAHVLLPVIEAPYIT